MSTDHNITVTPIDARPTICYGAPGGIDVAFSYALDGTTYTGGTTLRASANGNLQFRNAQGATDPANLTLPAAGVGSGQAVFPASAPTLFLLWDDWQMDPTSGNVPAGAGIYTKLQGTPPNREWIIEWRGRIKGDGATTTINNRAGIVFHENSDSFDYIYQQAGVGAASNGAGATIGADYVAKAPADGYTLLLALRSWEFEAFAHMRR